jgi:hypothetical protein
MLNLRAMYSGSPHISTDTFNASHEILMSQIFLIIKNYLKFLNRIRGRSIIFLQPVIYKPPDDGVCSRNI